MFFGNNNIFWLFLSLSLSLYIYNCNKNIFTLFTLFRIILYKTEKNIIVKYFYQNTLNISVSSKCQHIYIHNMYIICLIYIEILWNNMRVLRAKLFEKTLFIHFIYILLTLICYWKFETVQYSYILNMNICTPIFINSIIEIIIWIFIVN